MVFLGSLCLVTLLPSPPASSADAAFVPAEVLSEVLGLETELGAASHWEG